MYKPTGLTKTAEKALRAIAREARKSGAVFLIAKRAKTDWIIVATKCVADSFVRHLDGHIGKLDIYVRYADGEEKKIFLDLDA